MYVYWACFLFWLRTNQKNRRLRAISFFLSIIISFFLVPFSQVLAISNSLNYQGRILRADGSPLDIEDVSFVFQILNPQASCIVYEEQLDHVDMRGSAGIFDLSIGNGISRFPTGGLFKLEDAFKNSGTLNCSVGGAYSPSQGDVRVLRVMFYDGISWQTITPDNVIRFVPYALHATNAEKLGSNSASDFLLKAGLPTCGDGTFLTWNGSALTCAAVTGASGGTVTEVTSANSYLSVTRGSINPLLSVNVGTTPGTVAAGDDSRIVGALQTGTSAGGSLVGTFPNPILAVNSVNHFNINDGAVTTSKALTSNPGINRLLATDSVTGETLSALTCAANEILVWDTIIGWKCSSLNGLTAGNASNADHAVSANHSSTANFAESADVANRFSGELAGDVTGTQGATLVGKIAGYSLDLSTPPENNQVLTWDGSKWVAATLPSTAHFLTNSIAPGKIILGNFAGLATQTSISGDASLSETGLLTLTPSGVVSGSYKTVTVDSKGRVISGYNPSTLSGFGITDAVRNMGGVGNISAGLETEKPQEPGVGDLFVATDSQKIYRYNGTSWDLVSSAGGSGGTLTSITAGPGLTGGTIIGAGVIGLGTELSGLNSLSTLGFLKRTGAGLYSTSQIDLSSEVSGVLSASKGGTGYSAFADGQLLIGNSANNNLSKATLSPGAGISITNGNGSIVISNTGLTGSSAFSGDVSGFSTDISVDKLKGKQITAPTLANQIMIYDGTTWLNRVISGDANLSAAGVLSLATTGVAPGVYKSVTIDSKGRVTAGSNPTTLNGYGITDAISSSGGFITGNLNFQSDSGIAFKSPDNSNTVTLKGPSSSVGTSYILRWPAGQSTGSQALVNDGSGNLSWASLTEGSVTSVSGTAPIIVSSNSSAPIISISDATTNDAGVVVLATNGGTQPNTVVQANDTRLSDSRIPTGAAGGELSGTYPNPSVAKIQGAPIAAGAPTLSGQVLKYNGTNWDSQFISLFDLKSTVTGSSTFATDCTAAQTLTWTAATDNFICTDISISSSQVRDLAASATTDTTNASNINSGILNSSRLPVASGTSDGIINQLSQTFAGAKTFLSNLVANGNLTVGGTITSSNTVTAPSLRVTGGTPASGKVLTSDASGNATWQLPTSASSVVSLVDGTSIDVDGSLGNVFQVTLGGNRNMANPINLVNGQVYTIRIIQDGTGSRTLTWSNKYFFTGNSIPSATANSLSIATFVSDGTSLYNIGGYNLTGVVPFNFTNAVGVGTSTVVTSNSVTLSGIAGSVLASVSGSGTPQMSVNGGAWTSSASVTGGDLISIKATSSASVNSSTSVITTIGSYTSSWNITTTTNPSAFSFTNITDILNSTLITSNTITPTGYTGALPVSASGSGSPQISINGGGWVTSGTISPGQTLAVRATSSSVDLTPINITVSIGSINSTWTVTTGSILYAFTSHTFTNAGTRGRYGPALATLVSAYSNSWASNTNYFTQGAYQGYQKWKVPRTASYRIRAAGSAAHTDSTGGYGRIVEATVSLTKGEWIVIAVGQMGYRATSGGAGGASWVVRDSNNTPLVIGGGGGGTYDGTKYSHTDANFSSNGNPGTGESNSASGGYGAAGGTNSSPYGGSGGGFYSDGMSATHNQGGGGKGWPNGLVGGSSNGGNADTYAAGGFGGGGGTHGSTGGGAGGGGYSGGGGHGHVTGGGGGGGSYGITTLTDYGSNTGTGYVTITLP